MVLHFFICIPALSSYRQGSDSFILRSGSFIIEVPLNLDVLEGVDYGVQSLDDVPMDT